MAHFSAQRVQALLDLLNTERLTRIVDIGANPIHVPPYSGLMKMGGCEVWGFEPQVQAYERLVAAAQENEHYSPNAVGDGDVHDLHICQTDGFSSILPPNKDTLGYIGRWHNAMTVTETIPFETKRLDDIDDVPSPDLLKIDVQGAESMIFRNGAEKLSSSVAVITEVAFLPLYEGQPLFHDQAKILDDYGFLLFKFSSLVTKCLGDPMMASLDWRYHQDFGQLIDGDGVFVRSKNNLLDLDDEQLKHLAICADSVFASFDLCVRCLSMLVVRGVLEEAAVLQYIKKMPKQKK